MTFRRKRPALFKSGQWHFHQDNAPVHNSILVIDYLTKISIKTVPQPPYSQDLAPCDFCLFPKLRVCRCETIEEEKEAWWRLLTRSHMMTSIGPSTSCCNGTTSALQPEEITAKCPYEKSLETYPMILVFLPEFPSWTTFIILPIVSIVFLCFGALLPFNCYDQPFFYVCKLSDLHIKSFAPIVLRNQITRSFLNFPTIVDYFMIFSLTRLEKIKSIIWII